MTEAVPMVFCLFCARRPWEALEFFKESCGSGYLPDTGTYNTLMHGFCEHGYFDVGLFLFEQLQVNKVKYNMFTYNILIEAMCKAGLRNDVKKLLSRLSNDGLQPDVYTFNIIIDGLSRKGFLDEA